MAVSVIVRVRNEAVALAECLALLGRQRGRGAGSELIVVDHASEDASAEVARRAGAAVVSIPREAFSFGRALNLGAARADASSEVIVALSAHAYVRDPDWLDRLLGAFDDPRVAAASGERVWPDGSALLAPVRLGPQLIRGYPRWGYSNAAGGVRAELWRRRPFREDLPGAEDKEWARFWALAHGRPTVLDPGLVVDHDHTHDPVREIFLRARREAAAYAMFLDAGEASARGLLAEWFWDTRFYANPWRARLSHRRLARLLGERAGSRPWAPGSGR
ncbi:MAG TPA: glycosyltransferase [Solirubrobacteraceae bacterium]|nr:glycosyltransferase [Solirubrobacteraceae bacterium]